MARAFIEHLCTYALRRVLTVDDQDALSLPVALAALSREHIQDVEMMMAGAVVTVIPVLLLFLALQRYYIQGLLLGSVKG